MWTFHRILRIAWTEHNRNEKVLSSIVIDRELTELVKKHAMADIGKWHG